MRFYCVHNLYVVYHKLMTRVWPVSKGKTTTVNIKIQLIVALIGCDYSWTVFKVGGLILIGVHTGDLKVRQTI